jgi:hypothetical protein
MNKSQFFDHGFRQYERVQIRLPDRSADIVDGEHERYPAADNAPYISPLVGIEFDPGRQFASAIQGGADVNSECIGGFESVDDVNIVSPRFRKVFPGVAGRIG